jgi:hypothetical protein
MKAERITIYGQSKKIPALQRQNLNVTILVVRRYIPFVFLLHTKH